MVGLSEQIKIMENARALYAAEPSHASRDIVLPSDGHCVNTAISTSCSVAERYQMYQLFARYSGLGTPPQVVIFNELSSTEEVLAAFDQVISELKAKVKTDERVLQVS